MQPVPSVSVIIPTFNGEAFITEAIDSALAQTLPPAEIVVVDDGSTDGTLERVAAFGASVKVLRQSRRGVAAARNSGAAAATGEWLAFLDQDDVWLPHKTEAQLAVVREHSPLVYSDRLNVGDLNGLPVVQSTIKPLYDGHVFRQVILGNHLTASTVMVRTSAFRELGGFDTDLAGVDDWDLWIRIAARYPLAACREPLVRYRLHGGNAARDYRRMRDARLRMLQRCAALPAWRQLPSSVRRRAFAAAWLATAGDARRAGSRTAALGANARALAYWPFAVTPYLDMLRLALGR